MLLAGVCLLSLSVTLPAGGRAGCRVCGRSAAAAHVDSERLTLHSGPVQLPPVRATPCFRQICY